MKELTTGVSTCGNDTDFTALVAIAPPLSFSITSYDFVFVLLLLRAHYALPTPPPSIYFGKPNHMLRNRLVIALQKPRRV